MPLSSFVHWSTVPVQPLSISHQSQFPAVTISFNLAPGAALGQAVTAIEAAVRQMGVPITVTGSFQGTAQAFQSSLASQPYLIAAALISVYIILGILYESYILPLTILSTLPSAGVGALLTLLLFHYDLSVIALIGVILLIGIVKKNGIMMVDFAITAERRDGLTPFEAIRQACLLRFRPILMTTMAAMLTGCAADAGYRGRIGAAAAVGLRDGWRAGAEPAADAVHHAGGLPVPGPAAALAGTEAAPRADPGAEDGVSGGLISGAFASPSGLIEARAAVLISSRPGLTWSSPAIRRMSIGPFSARLSRSVQAYGPGRARP